MRRHEAEADRWFQQAREDIITAEGLVQLGRHYMACFVAQQAAEKALKAYLYLKGASVVLGHSIGDLCQQCAKHDAEFEDLRNRISMLDTFYIPTRYPNGLPAGIPAHVYTERASTEALDMARTAVQFVSDRMRPAQA